MDNERILDTTEIFKIDNPIHIHLFVVVVVVVLGWLVGVDWLIGWLIG